MEEFYVRMHRCVDTVTQKTGTTHTQVFVFISCKLFQIICVAPRQVMI